MNDDLETRRNDARMRAAQELWAWGWYDLAEIVRRESEPEPKHEARKPHPSTQIGRP